MTALSPCPFCGANQGDRAGGPLQFDTQEGGTPFDVYCWGCGVHTRGFATLEEAFAAWNRRAVLHASDCATHNEPAYPNGPCDCGAVS